MPGAYTARAAVVSTPSRPPGWPITWPLPGDPGYDPDPFFPAPFPPGYTPDYSLAVFGTESIALNGTASITGTFRDNSTYATNEPDVIVWTATVSSSPTRDVKLRFSGDEDYADSISSVCIFGTYWGATPDIEFELEEDDAGGTVVLTSKSAISGSYVGATLAIEVYDLSLVMSAVETMQYDGTLAVEVDLKDGESSKTEEPIGYTLTWTATISGVPVNLRFSGDLGYSSSISSSYSDLTDFWGAEKDIEFNLAEENDTDTVVLQVESTAFEASLIDMVNVAITAPSHVYTCKFGIGKYGNGAATIYVAPVDTYYYPNMTVHVYWHWFMGEWRLHNDVPEEFSIATGSTAVISSISEIGSIRYFFTRGTDHERITFTFRLYTDGGLSTTYTKTLDPPETVEVWLSFNDSTGEVTVINP